MCPQCVVEDIAVGYCSRHVRCSDDVTAAPSWPIAFSCLCCSIATKHSNQTGTVTSRYCRSTFAACKTRAAVSACSINQEEGQCKKYYWEGLSIDAERRKWRNGSICPPVERTGMRICCFCCFRGGALTICSLKPLKFYCSYGIMPCERRNGLACTYRALFVEARNIELNIVKKVYF